MKETTRVLTEDVADGLFTMGAQVAVRVAGDPVLDLAIGDDGTGNPMTSTTVFRVYCTIKPITAMAVALQVEAGRLDLDRPLAEHLPEVRAVADGTVTLRHVLTHTAGLHWPTAIELELVAPPKRAAALTAASRPGGWAVGRRAAYSEIFGWQLLGWLLEAVTEQEIGEHLRDVVLRPLGLHDTWIGMTDAEYDQVLPRLGLSFDLRAHQPFPLLLERGRRMCTEINPAHGGYTTAGDLARFYAALLAQLDGAGHSALPSPETLHRFTTSEGPPRFDEVLDRECEHGLGFMTGLAGHAFGRSCSPSSFGHSGNVGSSFAFADPDHDLAVAVVYNGITDHESAFLRRPAIIRAIYTDLAAAGAPEEVPTPPPDETRGRRHRWGRLRGDGGDG